VVQAVELEVGVAPSEQQQGSEPESSDARWTIMVFMGAGRVGDDPALDTFVDADLDEMEEALASVTQATLAGGSARDVRVFVEIHGLGPPTRHEIGDGQKREPVPAGTAGVDGMPVLNFLQWSLEKADHREKDHSMLVLWGHAYQFAMGRQQTPTGVDGIDMAELIDALRRFQERVFAEGAYGARLPMLDIIGFDTCDAATLELANQLNPFARYLLASQIGVPLPGWPYHTVLERLVERRGGQAMKPEDLGSFVVRKFCEEYAQPGSDGQPRPVSLTLLDLARAPEAFDVAEVLAGAIARACAEDADEMARIIEHFISSQTIDGKPFIDVADFCLNLVRHSRHEQVRQHAGVLGDILIRPLQEARIPGSDARGSFIIEHGRNSLQTALLHGVSLYAPHVVDDDLEWRATRFWYNKFDLSGETFWGRLVHVLAEAQ
jgi:Clostripain family